MSHHGALAAHARALFPAASSKLGGDVVKLVVNRKTPCRQDHAFVTVVVVVVLEGFYAATNFSLTYV